MFRNSFHPIQILSIFLLGITVMSLSVGLALMQSLTRPLFGPDPRSITDINWASSDAILALCFLSTGFLLLSGSIGLWLRSNWGRWLVQVTIILPTIVWLGFIGKATVEDDGGEFWPILGLSAALISISISTVLILNNRHWGIPYFSKSDLLQDNFTDLLDQ